MGNKKTAVQRAKEAEDLRKENRVKDRKKWLKQMWDKMHDLHSKSTGISSLDDEIRRECGVW
jgi:hypothetical protein